MASKKKKLLTVDQYEQKRGYGSNGLPTVDTYEKRMEERRQEQERQRQERLKQEEEKKRKEAFNNAIKTTWQKKEYDPEKERQERLNNSVLSWVSDLAKKNKENTATQTKLPTQKQEEYKRAASVYEGTADLGSWLSSRTKDMEEALSAKNAKNIRESANELKQYRYFDNGSDVNLWSPEKREEKRAEHQKTIEEAQKQLDELNRKPANQDVKNFQMRRYDGVQGLELQLTDEDRNKKETLQAQIDYAQKMIQQIDAQNEKEKKYNDTLNGYTPTDTEWHAKNQSADQVQTRKFEGVRGLETILPEKADGVYAVLNPDFNLNNKDISEQYQYRNAVLMTDKERDYFISKYNEGKKDEAWAFYEGLQPYLNQEYSYFESLEMREGARRFPVTSTILTEAAHIAQPLEAVANLPGQLQALFTGTENEQTDPYSSSYIMTRMKNGIRAQVADDLGDWDWVYQGLMSGVDSFVNVALAGGLGLKGKMLTIGNVQVPATQAATLALFHTQAFETSLQNTMTKGTDQFGYDFIEAWIDAAIETATEIWSVENMLSDPKNLMTYIGKIAISEPSEEVVGAIVEPYVKEMLGHENQYKERAKEIVANGGYFDNAGNWVKVNDMDGATRQAMREWNHDIRMAAQEALISVGPSIGMGSIRLANQNVNIGRELNPYNEEQTARQIAEAAAQLGEGTDSYKGAEKVNERLDEGKKVSNYRMGQLAQNVLRESQERTVETARQTRTEQITGYLQENGVSEEEAAGLAETVEKAIEKGGIENLSKKERQAIHANQAATNALYRFGMTEGKHTDVKTQQALAEEVKSRTEKESGAVKSISDLLTKNVERRVLMREATPDEISEAKGERINNNREVIVYDRKTGEGRFAQIEGIEVKKRNGNWNLRLRVAGQDRTLSASDVKLTNYQTAQVINQATNIPELYSEGYTNLLLDAANEGQFTNENIVDMMRDAKKLRLYAYAGFLSDQMPQTNLPQQLAERIWQQGTEEKYSNRKSQVAGYNRQKVGKAVYGEAVFGTEAWNDATKDLDADTVDWMETIAGVAQRAGIDVSFKNMTEDDKTWGWENKEGIGLNIAGMNYVRDLETGNVVQTGQKHHMLVTFGHEMTHWLMRNSMQGYNKLEKFVLQNYINDNGYDQFEEKINYRMYQMGESLDEAIAEIVADSCDQILLDKKVQEKIAKTDSKLFSEIKGFVKNLVERFKKAIKGDPQTSASQYSKAMAAHINEIRKLWLGAYDEALSGYITEDNGTRLTPDEYKKMVAEGKGAQESVENKEEEEYNESNEEREGNINDETRKSRSESIREEVNQLLRQDTRWALSGVEALRILKGNYDGIIRPGQKGYYLFRQALTDSVLKNNKNDPLIWLHGTDKEFSVFDIKELFDTDKPTGAFLTNKPAIANIYAGKIVNNKHIYPAGVYSQHNIEFNADEFNQDISLHNKALGLIQFIHEFAKVHNSNTNILNDLSRDVYRRYVNKFGKNIADKVFSYLGEYGDIDTVRINDAKWDDRKTKNDQLIVFDKERIIPATAKFWAENEKEISKATERRFSRAQLDNDYMAAVESGDEINQIRYVEEAARRAGYKDLAYHGTKMFGFTNFDMIAGQGMAFVAYNERLAKSYTTAGELRNISSRTGIPVNFYTLNDSELGEYVKDIFNRWGMMGVTSVRKIEGGENKSDVDLFEVKHKNDWEKNETTSKYRRFELYQALEEYTNPNAELDGIYQLYTKPKNQLVIDAEGKLWNEIPFDLYGVKVSGSINEETYEYTDTEWDEDFDPDIPHDGTANTREIAKWAKAHGYDSVRINNVSDNGGRNIELYNEGAEQVYGDIGIFFNENDIKSADPIVYDDNGEVIPLSERFNDQKSDIRWSRAITEEQQAEVDAAEEQGIDLDPVNQTASMYFSRASFERSEYFKDPEKMARMLAKNVLGSESKANIAKATKWIKDVTSISAMIAERPEIRDYFASPGRSSFKSNPEYGGSIDSSTICAKRRLQTGTLDAIQRALPDYAMTAEDFLRVRRMMKEKGYEVSCGLCFVESSRKNIAKYAKQFMNEWNSQHPENQVNMVQINTVLGLEDTRLHNKEVYDAYEKFMNKLAQRKPKLFEMRSEYDNDIIKHFKKDESVEAKNRNGGMRINSFSDFEIVHLIDMMQVIMDMSNVGLAGQAYTKVKEFVQALGPTGLKINMSMIAAGVDENGKIIFDEIEGMKWNDVKDLRDKYADNVGTVCVVFTEDQLMAAMADDRIDFIIPFHRSQWNKSNYKDIGLPENVKDFTYWQNERYREPVYGTKKDGTKKKLRATNYMPNEYWNPELSGKENAEAYLKMCAENNKIPKFWKWLQSNGDGSFSLKADGSTDGYWKLLGDFKMYNHLTGEYAPQMPVKPEFDMEQSRRMLEEYKGGHESFPEASDVVQEFVKEKKQGRKGLSTGKNGRIQLAGNEIESRMSRWTESGMDVNYWMEHATPSMVQTEDERELISLYKGKRTSISLSLKKQGEYRARIRQLEAVDNPSTDVKSEITALKNKLEIEKKKVYRLEEEILQITRNDGWAGMMYQHNMVFRDYVEGKTQEQVRQTVDDMLKLVEQTQEQIAKDTESLKKLATHQAVQTMKSFMGKTSLGRMASILRKTYNSTMNKAEIEDRLAEMALKKASGQDITADTETLAQDLLDKMRGVRTDALESLRGQTFVIGQSLAEELKKENSSIKELQNRIKGSGVNLTTGVKSSTGEIDKHSRISEQWAELREKNGALPDVENMAEIDKLHTIIDFIEGELRASTGAEQFNADFDEVAAMVRASVGNITTYLVDDPKARAQINNLMKQIADLSKATEKTAADMQGLYGQLDEVMKAGERAKSITTVMERDVNEAIEYYNTTARVAAEKERTKVRKALIAQLRSETTEKLLKQQEHYRSMIENQQKARELHQDNEALRRKISTVASRMANRLFAETDQKNVPEETKGLVREVLRMLAENDSVFRRVTNWDKDRIDDAMKRLMRLSNQHGEFVPAKDLDFLVIKAPNEADNDYTLRDKVWQDILDIESGLEAYRKADTATLVNQQAKNDALTKIQEALSEIYSVVRARSEAFIQGKRYEVATLAEQMENEMAGSKYKGERTGKIGRAFNIMEKMVGYGNLTPEYFFKNLKNGVMKILHGGFHDAEQRAGLEALRAKLVVQQIAKDTHYDTWDPQEKHQVKLPGGREITMTTEQIMALYATWKRESSQLRPEETAHLLKGGFVLAQGDLSEGIYGRQRNDQRPIRMNKETLEGLRNYLTEDQIRYVVEMVNYMSGELAEIGNETSMQQYGIKKFTERYYYPIKAWGGVLNKSSASGIVNKSDARAMRQSFTKNLTANAQNAIEIGDFTPTVMNHIVGMITFNTVGPAVENMNKVLNQQLTYGEAVYDENGEIAEDNRYKRNVRAIFQDAYGVNALKYLERFMDDVNGGITRQQDKSIQEKLLSVFRKGAVAGSLSVAAQQPLSYIRAAMEINPVYLARALSPTHWGKIHDEMLKYSGIAVIKDMGRFDMNQGQSMIDYITPEEKISKARKAGRTAAEMTTILPQKMDALTWGRMWIACKMEQAALNKGMDTKSDEFMEKVAQRFNEVMRKTQVYDSLMVKSQNMRSTNYAIKAMTSFMAEPTLSLNVLADAVRNFNSKGGKTIMRKALVTFITSAAAQALVKAIMSSGRSPDKKKRLEEQFYIKFMNLFMSEANPLTLVPGYSDIIELLKNGELADDAWSVLGKFKTVWQAGAKWVTGKSDNPYRSFEDTIGQLAQLFTNVPAKNLMRDARAIYNFLNPETYAQREYSPEVVKYGIEANFWNADNMIGVVNSYLKDAGGGFQTTQTAYYNRIYKEERAGNQAEADALKKYLVNTSKAQDPEKTVNDAIRNLYEKDESLTGPEKVQVKLDAGQSIQTIKTWITNNYKAKYIAADTKGRRQLMNELTKMYKLLGISGDDAMKIVTKWVKDEKKK